MRVNALYPAIRLHSAENVLSGAVPEVPPRSCSQFTILEKGRQDSD